MHLSRINDFQLKHTLIIMETDKKIKSIGLIKCALNEECNFCNNPQDGSYARMIGYDSAEIAYHICGKCAIEKIKAGVESCENLIPPINKKN